MEDQHNSFLYSLFGENYESRKKIFYSMKAKADAKRTITERLADFMTKMFGSIKFLIINIILFVAWILINTGQIKGIPPFDPYPFIHLITVVSLEAIILAIFVLISQNRNFKLDELREETNLKINIISEKENIKLMKMLVILLNKNGVDLSQDPELKKLLKPVSEEEIEKKLEKEIL